MPSRKTEATILSEPDRVNGRNRVDDGSEPIETIGKHMRLPIVAKPECAACAHTKAPAPRGPLLIGGSNLRGEWRGRRRVWPCDRPRDRRAIDSSICRFDEAGRSMTMAPAFSRNTGAIKFLISLVWRLAWVSQHRVGDALNRRAREGLGRFALVKTNRRSRDGVALVKATARAHTALFEHRAHMPFAFPAAERDTQLELQFFERLGAFPNGTANMAVGNGLAHTNDHAIGTR